MLEIIEKLLILQDRDQKLQGLREELQQIPVEEANLLAKAKSSTSALDNAKLRVKQLETERKKLELEVDTRKQQIEKYSLQQFQTKKNEEYRALGNEIETCKAAIAKLDDQQIEFMEQIEGAQRQVAAANEEYLAAKKTADGRIAELKGRQAKLEQEFAKAESERNSRATEVDEVLRAKYDRLVKNKGGRVVVGIAHGVCGGCHMGISRSIVLQCQGGKEIIQCPNCSRILYYSRDMDLQVAD
jgi:predicted  nucleic acid-binding Zn-ribbon protein